MKFILLSITVLFHPVSNLSATEMPSSLKMRIGQMGIHEKSSLQSSLESQKRLKASWPNKASGLFQGISKKVEFKITSKADHLKAISSIPKHLMKDRIIGTTLEIDGWFYTSIEFKQWDVKTPTWFNVIASSKNSQLLHFSYSW